MFGGCKVRKNAQKSDLTKYTPTQVFQFQFYILHIILGGISCIVSLPIVILNILIVY